MDIILHFSYNNKKYCIINYNNKILLYTFDNKIVDEEKKFLGSIIKLLMDINFSKENFFKYKITILNKNDLNISTNVENAIVLDIPEENRRNILSNCSSLYTNQNNNINVKPLIFIIFILLICIGSFIFLGNFNSKNLLEKYTYIRDPELADFYNEEYNIINITTKQTNNLFLDSFIKFENPYSNYSLSRGMEEKNGDSFNMNIYQGNNIPILTTMYVEEQYVDSFEYIDLEKFENEYNISTKKVFKRNNINNSLDLMYNIILYSKKEINSNSSKNEIIDNFTFEYFRPLIIPYDKNSNMNKILFFTGDKYGYATITDETIMICLKKGNSEYRIGFAYEENNNKLTEQEIINIVSSAKF